MSPHYGRKSSNDTACLSTVDFNCVEGFNLIGQSRLVCQTDRTWNGPTPDCEGIISIVLGVAS